jgi:hypothetical protein
VSATLELPPEAGRLLSPAPGRDGAPLRPRLREAAHDAFERWAREQVDKEFSPRGVDCSPVASRSVMSDIRRLQAMHRATWEEREARMRLCNGRQVRALPPLEMMAEGTYGALLSYPPPARITTTSTSSKTNLYPQLTYAPIPINGILAAQAYRIVVGALLTTGTSPGTLAFDVVMGATGSWTTGGTAVAGGASFGACPALTPTASITGAFYYIYGDITVRTTGLPGSNTTAVGMFHIVSTQDGTSGVAGPGAVSVNATAGSRWNQLFGGTAASFDNSVASGIALGCTHSVTTITHNVDQVHAMDWN